MTTATILKELKSAGKPVGLQQLYRYFFKFNILPCGVRQRPQHYPPDTTTKILLGLGWQDIQAGKTAQVHIPALNGKRRAVTTNTRSHLTPALTAYRSIASMNQLRAERAKARGTK